VDKASASAPYESRSALSLYMKDAVEVPLLTIEEENALAARIHRGDMEAREHMIRANLRLVVKIARDYDGFGLPLLDLINEGNIGLMKGVERFDPAKGGKLSTYASWWIKQSIKRGSPTSPRRSGCRSIWSTRSPGCAGSPISSRSFSVARPPMRSWPRNSRFP